MTASENFELYLERYCAKHKISPEVAKTHKLVQAVKEQYEEVEKYGDKIIRSPEESS